MGNNLPVIDGIAVERAATPGSIAELSDVMRQARESGTSMIPMGGETKLHLGNPPRSAGLAVRTCRLRGITEYEPDNLTVSVLAGTPLEELQKVLKNHEQFLPLDPPRPEAATVGGLVACNTSGPLRFRYGTIRDLLIGIKIVHADGSQTKAGGKLVKNVSGYDMCKLYTGSLGTLGILVELTFKLQPRSEAAGTMLLGYTSAEKALEATQAILKAQLLPDAMEAWNAEAFRTATGRIECRPWVLMIRFGEVTPAVEWQLGRLTEIAHSTGADILGALQTADSEQFWRHMASAREAIGNGEEIMVKCSVLYRSTAATARRIEELGQSLGARTSLFCNAGDSVLYGRYRWENGSPATGELQNGLTTLRNHCSSFGGHSVVERARPDVKAGLDVWGYQAPALRIMRRIKGEFDPKSLLNPGRFVGGI